MCGRGEGREGGHLALNGPACPPSHLTCLFTILSACLPAHLPSSMSSPPHHALFACASTSCIAAPPHPIVLCLILLHCYPAPPHRAVHHGCTGLSYDDIIDTGGAGTAS